MDELVKIEFGYTKLFEDIKYEDGFIYFGGYSVKYDQNGEVVSRTEPVYNIRAFLDSPRKQTLWGKLKAWMS